VPGTAIFLTRFVTTIPFLITEHVAQMRALSETVIALTVKFEEIPRVAPRERIELAKLAEGFWHITMHFGFVQVPDIPAALRQAKSRGCPIDLEDAIYFGGRDAGSGLVQHSSGEFRGSRPADRDLEGRSVFQSYKATSPDFSAIHTSLKSLRLCCSA
jgi:KUP system potassium uptake protein